MKQVYICNDTMSGVGSALYDAWKESRNKDAGIEFRGKVQQQLFCEYKTVDESREKADRVFSMIRKNMGSHAYTDICNALLSDDSRKGEAVFRTMQAARYISDSTRIMEHLGNSDVAKVFELSRKVAGEIHRYMEFIRFRELKNGVLVSEIQPKAQILLRLAEHFSNRFPLENWMIYDRSHAMSLIHPARSGCRLLSGVMDYSSDLAESYREDEYEKLWKIFFESISIKERENLRLQKNMLPLRYRNEMTEFFVEGIPNFSCIKSRERL